jgi:hypothetical protein
MVDIKLKPTDPPLYYVGIDGTDVLDTVAWGHLWNARFGWRNLLWELDKNPADNQRRVDKAHPLLPILREQRNYRNNNYADTCIMPEGKDGKGLDSNWPSQSGPNLNVTQMNQGLDFMRSFILSPGADKVTSSLNDTGRGVVASVVYISSHGVVSGDMFGATSNHIAAVEYTFSLIEAVVKNKRFSGPDWLLLSNCNTLVPATHNDWIDLMNGSKPLRGIVGFQDVCPLPEGSVDVFAAFINRLAKGKTILEAWSQALTAMGMERRWVVLCHENAEGDTIADWNARKLKPIPPGVPKIFMFNQAKPKGVQVVHTPDPFKAFWSKGTPPVAITAANRSDPANKIVPHDTVSITVKPPAPATTFTMGTTISITLIFIRPNYQQAINVNRMFTVKGQLGASAPSTVKLNTDRPSSTLGPSDGDDSWVLVVTGTPTEVILTLECIDLDLSRHNLHNVPYWLRVKLSAPSSMEFDFIRNGSIIVM